MTSATDPFLSLILYDSSRMAMSEQLIDTLEELADNSAVKGVLLDLASSDRVRAAHDQADTNFSCVYATQLVALSIRDLVRDYVESNPELRYLVIVGGDDVVPFFREPDEAQLETEDKFTPPVADQTAAQAALRRGYLLTQDRYGVRDEIQSGVGKLPIFSAEALAVGRLAESEAEIMAQIDAFLCLGTADCPGSADGLLPPPSSALVTGYDFLADGAKAVAGELDLGLGTAATRLISERTCSPAEPCAWNDQQLEQLLFNQRFDLQFLSGHFNPYGALAADFETELRADELAASPADLRNAIVFSGGCHSGYNVPGSALPTWNDPNRRDFVQVFAGKGATLIANTGYQYGEVYSVEYGERLYLEFSRALRSGTGPVTVGDALLNAKRAYLAGLGDELTGGIYQKSLLIATLYGLPMLAVDMPGNRFNPDSTSIVDPGALQTVSNGPGAVLGLGFADANLNLSNSLTTDNVTLIEPTDENPKRVITTVIAGENDRVLAQPGEPVLPQVQRNVTVPGRPLQGVVFLEGNYTDLNGVIPLLSAPATELHQPRGLFISPKRFFPPSFWRINTFGTLFDVENGSTSVTLTPAQFISDSGSSTTGTLRRYETIQLRLYYGELTDTFLGNGRLLAGPPVIARVASDIDSDTDTANFDLTVIGDPAAGVQNVFVTYTYGDGTWQYLSLVQDASDTRQWRGSLPLSNNDAGSLRFLVQAVSGVGKVAIDTNDGAYYSLGDSSDNAGDDLGTTTLTLDLPPASFAFGENVSFSAVLTGFDANSGTERPLDTELVTFRIGNLTRIAVTDASGRATASVIANVLPGTYSVSASYAGSSDFAPTEVTAERSTSVERAATELSISPQEVTVAEGEATGIVATLNERGERALFGANVYFVIPEANLALVRSTDFLGRARLGTLDLGPGTYTVQAYFGGTIPAPVNQAIDDPFYLPAPVVQASLTIERTVSEPEITSQPVTVAEQGQLYSYQIEASGGPDLSYRLITPPEGMSIDTQGLISWTPSQLPGIYPVTVEVRNAAGKATQDFTIELAIAQSIQRISPVLECVIDRGPGQPFPAERYLARFGYNNPNSFQVELPAGSRDNRFRPSPRDRDQPSVFMPGRQRFVFEVIFPGGRLVWTLNGRTSTASRSSTPCAP